MLLGFVTCSYLLDDVLAAVDAHVGAHIMDQCVRNFLGSTEDGAVPKTRVLVTNNLQYVPVCIHVRFCCCC